MKESTRMELLNTDVTKTKKKAIGSFCERIKLKDIREQIISIQKEMKPLERTIELLKNEIGCLVDEALSMSKYNINDLVQLKRSGQKGFVKDIVATCNPTFVEEEKGTMFISYLIGAIDKDNNHLKLKTISGTYFPEETIMGI